MTRIPAFILLVFMAIPVWSQNRPIPDADGKDTVLDNRFPDMEFRYVGPSRGGRVTAVTGHRSQPRTFYMGATGGGVWRTTDAGQSWDNITDGFFDRSPSIGAIDVADANPDIIYVGTGSDGIRSNVIIGSGMYRSRDAGETWDFIGLPDAGQIGAVVVHPTNPEVVWVAALGSPFGSNPDRGIYRTVDGGETWEHVLFVSDETGGIDLELNPSDPNTVYAAMWRAERKPWTIISGDDTSEDGVYVSRDGGETWDKKSTGLPQDLIGKIDFAVTPADPSRVYALVEATPEKEGLYRSNDQGETWHLVSNDGSLMTRPFYYTNVDADPTDADRVYVNNLGFHRSDDGGKTWRRMGTPHGDNHDMWINPDDPDIFIQSNDGGANVTLDGGGTWSTQNNQPTAELYQVDVDLRFPYWLYAGQQDNSTISVPSMPVGTRSGGPTAFWETIGGCETGPAVPKTDDPDMVYANCKGRFGLYNRRTGQEMQFYVGAWDLYGRNPADLEYRFQRTVPIEVSPHDPNVVFHGSQYVHRTADGGRNWEIISPDLTAFRSERQIVSGSPITRDVTGEEHYSVLYVIEESPVQAGVIWTGANDGPVHVTQDGGTTWTDVTPAGMPPEGRINQIDPSPFDAGTAYVTGYRYLLNDFTPYAYRTTDYGETWTSIVSGIPDDEPMRVIREDTDRPGVLYGGTDRGFYVSWDWGDSWQRFHAGLPVTPVSDLKVHQGDIVLSTMGRGFWILDDITPLRQWTPEVADEPYFFEPAEAIRTRMGGGFSRGSDAPEYPSPGARFDYWLDAQSDEDITLEILDPSGSVIRTFENEAPKAGSRETQDVREPRRFGGGASSLDRTVGVQRFVWDMRHDGADYGNGRRGRGPMAVPGTYTARLMIGDWMQERAFELGLDPRVVKEGATQADLEAQLAFNMSMIDLAEDANGLLSRVDSLLKAGPGPVVDDRRSGGDRARDMPAPARRAELEAIKAELETDNSDSYPPPMLLSQIGYLSGMTSRADQAPGNEAFKRRTELLDWLDALETRVDAVQREGVEDR